MNLMGELIETLIKALPYSEQVRDITIDEDEHRIEFEWRGNLLRINAGRTVERKDARGFWSTDDFSMVMESLLFRTYRDILDIRRWRGADRLG